MSLKIMIIDDEPGSVKLMRSLAAPLDHTVLTFEDSQEAGRRAEEQRFDVVFVGMRAPQTINRAGRAKERDGQVLCHCHRAVWRECD